MDSNALPKGHIIGWTPPSSSSAAKSAAKGGTDGEGGKKSAAAKKNEKRRAKKAAEKADVIRSNWEDDDDEQAEKPDLQTTTRDAGTMANTSERSTDPGQHERETAQEMTLSSSANGLADQLERLNV